MKIYFGWRDGLWDGKWWLLTVTLLYQYECECTAFEYIYVYIYVYVYIYISMSIYIYVYVHILLHCFIISLYKTNLSYCKAQRQKWHLILLMNIFNVLQLYSDNKVYYNCILTIKCIIISEDLHQICVCVIAIIFNQ